MLSQSSRYRNTQPFESEEPMARQFQGTRARDIRPVPGVIEHTLTRGERLDLLALHYYGDSQRWWLILDANPGVFYAGDLESEELAGTVIVIPQLPEGVRRW